MPRHLAKSLLEISNALKEINRIVNPDFDVDIYIEAVGKGSFRAGIKTLAKKVRPLNEAVFIPLLVSLFACYLFEKIFSDDLEINIIVNDHSYIVEAGDQRVVLPKEAQEPRNRIVESTEVEKCVSKAFSI